MSTKPKLKKIPLPEGLPKLPKGAVFLGDGDSVKPDKPFVGWCYNSGSNEWIYSEWVVGFRKYYYAAPADSDIARKILGETAKPVTKRKAAKKTITKPAKTVTKPAKAKKPVTLDLSKESVGSALVAAAHAASFGIEFCESADRLGITLPNWLPALPPVPAGYDRWEPRGFGWSTFNRPAYAYYPARTTSWVEREAGKQSPEGKIESFYIEAVRDEKTQAATDNASVHIELHQKEIEQMVPLVPCEKPALDDPVNRPSHYTQGGVECIDAIQSALSPEEFRGYLRGCAMKYLWRGPHKGNYAQDLAKAKWYLDRLAATIEKEKP